MRRRVQHHSMQRHPVANPLFSMTGAAAVALTSSACIDLVDDRERPDASVIVPDAGEPDAGNNNPNNDGGNPRPDAGDPERDAGEPERDAGEENDAGIVDDRPRILSFAAQPTEIPFPAESTLRWEARGVDRCRIDPNVGFVDAPSGTAVVRASAPNTTDSYTLTCSNDDGDLHATTTIRVTSQTRNTDVTISGSGDLNGLNTVNFINGDVFIQNATSLNAIDAENGLAGLTRIEGSLLIQNNNGLSSVELPNLEFISGDLLIESNVGLSNISMPKLAEIDGNVYISRNFSLAQDQVTSLVEQIEDRRGVAGFTYTFRNNPTELVPALNQAFFCQPRNAADGLQILVLNNGDMKIFAEDQQGNIIPFPVVEGDYTSVNGNLSLVAPNVAPDQATDLEFEFDRLIRFGSAVYSRCHAVAAPTGVLLSGDPSFACPADNTGGVLQNNTFTLFGDGGILWQRSLAAGNQQPTIVNQLGIYVISNGQIFLGFGDNDAVQVYLTGTINAANTQILLNELNPALGPCIRQ